MTNDIFNEQIARQVQKALDTLSAKGYEYGSKDRLGHFKRAGALLGGSPELALFGMLNKHLVSLAVMCENPKDYPMTLWDEKIGDAINYLLILSALIREVDDDEEYRD